MTSNQVVLSYLQCINDLITQALYDDKALMLLEQLSDDALDQLQNSSHYLGKR